MKPIEEALSPVLSIVIPAYGSSDKLERCLQAIERERQAGRIPAHEIIVADDATPGGLDPKLRAQYPHVNWLLETTNLGFSGNTNRGVKASQAAVLCLLNTDMYVEPGFFEDSHLAFHEDPKLFAVTAQIKEPSGNNDGYKELRLEHSKVILKNFQCEAPESQRSGPIPYANGGGSFFSRALFDELGGFDPIFTPYYWEDTDLGYRAWKRGYHIRYDPSLSLIHDHQGSIGKQKRKRVKRIFKRNRTLFVWRNNTAVSLPKLVWASSIKPAFKALARFRWLKLWTILAEMKNIPAAARTRRQAFRLDRRLDSELQKIWADDRAKHSPEEPQAQPS